MTEDTTATSGVDLAQQLAREGYCVIPGVLSDNVLQSLRQHFDETELSRTPRDNFGNSGAFIVADYLDPVMTQLLTWPKTLETLATFGFADVRLHNFYVSTKPPKADALAWHSDLFYRYEETTPAELFLIYYLQNTNPTNGCLRVVPKSHRWSHEKRHAQPNNAEPRHDEIDVPIQAGDLFVGDRRILHATHANNSDSWRTCLTIAYAPDFAKLPESVQALIVTNQCLPPKNWWDDTQLVATINKRLRKLLPKYTGHALAINTE